LTTVISTIRVNEKTSDLSRVIKSLEKECRNCAPITPLQCISQCQVYKLKNELRALRETMNTPNYTIELFNALKNETRLHILHTIVNGKYSLDKLQEELRKTGYRHSQGSISKEYLLPLMTVGLATEAEDKYSATTFGNRLTIALKSFPEFAVKLPAHSECHEETLLQSLLSGPKTFEEIRFLISPKIASRIVKRLRSTGLIETPKEKDYVFFLKSKRDPKKENFTVNERKVYNSIASEGTSAGKLAKNTGLSLRRVYENLKHLKGKKLVFTRRVPKTYGLTCKGEKLSLVLKDLQQIVEDTWDSSRIVFQDYRVNSAA
jgi:DNA-binding transcriptional ArsR family regulator